MRLRFGAHEIDRERFALTRDGARVEIEPQTLEFLFYLIERRDRLVTKDEIHRDFWGGRFVSDAALSSLVKDARRAVGDNGRDQAVIETEHGRGFRFVAPTAPVARAPDAGRADPEPPAPAAADGPTIAVAPFENTSRDPESEVFTDGVTDEIITGLSRSGSLTVLSREAVRRLRAPASDPRALAATLGADYLVTGSVLKAGGAARVHVALTDAASGSTVWARRYDVTFGELFAALDEVAEQVLGALEPEVLGHELRRGPRGPHDETAWLLFVRANALLSAPTRADTLAARALLLEALGRDTSSSRVMASIAMTHLWDLYYGWSPDAAASFQVAADMAAKAVAAGGGSLAWTALAACKLLMRDHDGALADHRQALAHNPNAGLAHGFHALTLVFADEPRAALDAAARAMRLSPDDPRAPVWLNAESLAAFFLGDFERAHGAARKACALKPEYPASWRLVAATAAELGRADLARDAVARLLALLPGHRASDTTASLPFRRPAQAVAYAAALVKAGLPRGVD